MKRTATTFAAVLLLTSSFLFAVDEPALQRLVAAVRVWVVNGELAEDADPLVIAVQSGAVGTYQVEGLKPKGGGPREYWTITITKQGEPPAPQPPGPGPEPQPKPQLTGLALQVWEQAKGLPPADCKRLADNYETVSSMIAAGGIRDLTSANAKLRELNRALNLPIVQWANFASWLDGKFNTDVQTITAAQKAISEVAQGLRAVR